MKIVVDYDLCESNARCMDVAPEYFEVRESKSRPQWGIVQFEHRGVNQRGETVVTSRRMAMMRRKPA